MKYKAFDKNSGLYASELILGGAMFGGKDGYSASPEVSRNILKKYIDAGGNFIDTADAYKLGESETIIGELLTTNRNDFILSSKFTRSSQAEPTISAWGNNRKNMISSVEASLKRLKTDRIDIYIAHFDDQITPAEELARGFEDLVRAGKIIYGGLSNFPAWKMAKTVQTSNLLNLAPIITLQTEYSLIQRTPEKELIPMSKDFGLGVMAYSPLAGGLLTGKYRQDGNGRIKKANKESQITDPRNNAIIDALFQIEAETGIAPANAAVAWIIAKGFFPVIGPRTAAQIEAYLHAPTTLLTAEHLQRLDDISNIPVEYPHDINRIQQALMLERPIK